MRLDKIEPAGWMAIHLALLVAFSLFAFGRNVGFLFPGGDGTYAIHTVINQRLWTPFSFGFFGNPLQGLGDMELPTNLWLVPGYALSTLFLGVDGATSPFFQVSAYTVFSAELFVATLCLARALGVGLGESLGAAWLTPLLALPYFGVPLLYPLLMVGPIISTAISDTILVVAAIACLGRRNALGNRMMYQDLCLGLAILGLLAHVTLFAPMFIIVCGPVIALGLLGLVAGAEKHARVAMIAAVALAAAVLVVTGFAFFVVGLFDYTVPRVLGDQLEIEPMKRNWQFVSNWFYLPAVAGKKLIIFAAFGLAVAIGFGDKRLRFFAIAVAMAMAITFGVGTIVVETDFWRFPSPVYYEMFIVPFYTIFAVYGVAKSCSILYDVVRRARPNAAASILIFGSAIPYVLIIPALAFYAARQIHNQERIWGPYPPTATPLTSILKKKIALTPGGPFRGRVATLLLINKDNPVGWTDLVGRNAPRVMATGNDYFWSGLWPMQVPTLFQYTPYLSPAFFRAAVRLLGRPEDKQVRNVIILRRPEPRALALFGVRFVISDTVLPAPFRLEISEKTFGDETLYLYEVPNVNLGSYSPVEMKQARSYEDALDQLENSGFDPQRTAILFEPLGGEYQTLIPAEGITLKVERGGIAVQAQSAGASMVLLPFEFSNCLTLTAPDTNDPAAKLVRVNAVETGVLFRGRLNAKISYFTGPFSGAGCRLQDKKDVSRLIRAGG